MKEELLKTFSNGQWQLESLRKDDAPHQPNSPEDSAHDIVEEDRTFQDELKDLSPEEKQIMLTHLREFKKDPKSWKRSKENKRIGKD